VLSGEATNTNFIVFGFTQSGLKPTIYRTRDEHANHYTTDAVQDVVICMFYVIVDKKKKVNTYIKITCL
jgi:hypothetical protein